MKNKPILVGCLFPPRVWGYYPQEILLNILRQKKNLYFSIELFKLSYSQRGGGNSTNGYQWYYFEYSSLPHKGTVKALVGMKLQNTNKDVLYEYLLSKMLLFQRCPTQFQTTVNLILNVRNRLLARNTSGPAITVKVIY